MNDAYVIEVDGVPLGLAVRDGHRFRFVSTEPALHALDRTLYPSLRAMRNAVVRAFRAATNRTLRHRPAPVQASQAAATAPSSGPSQTATRQGTDR
jgi:hypothetical protein